MTMREQWRRPTPWAARTASRSCPPFYEHKGALAGKSPSRICRNAEYLYAGLRREFELYHPDMPSGRRWTTWRRANSTSRGNSHPHDHAGRPPRPAIR